MCGLIAMWASQWITAPKDDDSDALMADETNCGVTSSFPPPGYESSAVCNLLAVGVKFIVSHETLILSKFTQQS